MRILTIIVAYNFGKWIKPCLESVLRSIHPTDILVIDNGSEDNTLTTIKQNYPSVRIIDNGQNLGFGKANNIGMEIALKENYQAVFLLNQDAWIDKETIGTLASLSLEYPDFGILSPLHLNGEGNRLDKGFADYIHASGKENIPYDRELVEADFINAAFWFIPVSTLKTVGGFSPLFRHYGEDKDYINRLHYHRLKIGYSPRVCGNHDRESRQVSRRSFFHSEYVYHLSEYANINYTFARAFAYGVLASLKKSFTASFHGRFKDGATYLALSGKLLAKHRETLRIRQMAKTNQANFIISNP